MKVLLIVSAVMAFAFAEDFAPAKIGNIVMPYRRQTHTNDFVAFSSGLTASQNISNAANVVYDKVFLNNGNGYDPTTGTFTCPHNGVYVFIFHGLSEVAGTLYLDLYKNDEYQITGYAHNGNDWASASNSITLSLHQGDTVHITGHGSSQLYGMTDEVYSTFSGFILIPQNQDHGNGNGR